MKNDGILSSPYRSVGTAQHTFWATSWTFLGVRPGGLWNCFRWRSVSESAAIRSKWPAQSQSWPQTQASDMLSKLLVLCDQVTLQQARVQRHCAEDWIAGSTACLPSS